MHSYRVTDYRAPLARLETEPPVPQGAEVLLAVRAAGICHTDLHVWDGGYDLGTGELSLQSPLPLTMGHEVVGTLVAAGPDATGVEPGRTYLVYPWIGCGACAWCARDEMFLCGKPRFLGIFRDGGYADRILVPDARFLIDVGDLDPATTAPHACSGLTVYSALAKAGARIADEPIGIVGAGGLGLMCLRLLAALGGRGAVVVEIDPAKRQAALDAGALAAIDGAAPDASRRIAAAAGGAPPGVVIDFVGSPATAKLAFAAVAKGGTLIVVGLFGGTAPWALPLIPLKDVTIRGNYVGSLAELHTLVALVRSGAVTPIPIDRRPLAQATAALEDLRAGQVVGRCVLVPQT